VAATAGVLIDPAAAAAVEAVGQGEEDRDHDQHEEQVHPPVVDRRGVA
jgi:hypothetical protein